MVADALERKQKNPRTSNGWRKPSAAQGAAPSTAERRKHSSPERGAFAGQAVAPSSADLSPAAGGRAVEWSAQGDASMVDLDAVLDQANLQFVEQHNKVRPTQRAACPRVQCAVRPVRSAAGGDYGRVTSFDIVTAVRGCDGRAGM